VRFKKDFLMILFVLVMIYSVGCTEKTNNSDSSSHKIERQENWTSIDDEIFVSTGG